jgi:hypothetical protein
MLNTDLIGPEGLCIQIEYEEPYEPFLIETNVLTDKKYEQLLNLVTKNKVHSNSTKTKKQKVTKRRLSK